MKTGMTEGFLLIFLAAGLATAVLPELEDLYRMVIHRISMLRRSFHNEDDWLAIRREQYENRLPEHVRRMLQMTFSMGTRRSVRTFFLLSGSMAVLILFLAARWLSFVLAVTAAACSGSLPYLLLRCMVQERRVASSMEGEILVTEILNHYKIHYNNMQEAIEAAALHMEDAPHSRQLLLNLSRGLQKTSSSAEMKGLMEEFRFSIGTSWAAILTEDMYLACTSGLRVTDSLSDLASSMREARKLEELNRRENNEARLILKYLVPACSLLMAAGGIRFFGLSMEEFLRYQFGTGPGITWFLLTLVTYLAAIFVHLLLSRRKFDL
ncbi:MAG: hypothetical protein ACI4WY_00470 [Anaerovoracaceae bacterium]